MSGCWLVSMGDREHIPLIVAASPGLMKRFKMPPAPRMQIKASDKMYCIYTVTQYHRGPHCPRCHTFRPVESFLTWLYTLRSACAGARSQWGLSSSASISLSSSFHERSITSRPPLSCAASCRSLICDKRWTQHAKCWQQAGAGASSDRRAGVVVY